MRAGCGRLVSILAASQDSDGEEVSVKGFFFRVRCAHSQPYIPLAHSALPARQAARSWQVTPTARLPEVSDATTPAGGLTTGHRRTAPTRAYATSPARTNASATTRSRPRRG